MKIIKKNKVIKTALSLTLPLVIISCGTEQKEVSPQLEKQAELTESTTNPTTKPIINPRTKPNILWIITDDQRPDSVSYYNQKVFGTKNSPLGYVESPNVDKLAAEGVFFSQAFFQPLVQELKC